MTSKLISNLKKVEMYLPEGSDLKPFVGSMLDQGKNVSAYEVIALAKELNLSFDSFVEKEFDANFLSSKLGKSSEKILEYTFHEDSFARKKTLSTISKYFDNHFGEAFLNQAHQNLGISRADLNPEEHNNKISPILVMDFFESLMAFDVHPSVFQYMAATLSSHAVPKEVRAKFEGLNAIQSMDLFTSETVKENFDNLFIYDFYSHNKGDNSLTVRVSPVRERHQQYGNKLIGNKALCCYKTGVFESFLNLSRENVVFSHESECMYDGGDYCHYHFHYKESSVALKHKPSFH